ncbi:DNA-3-methyladenine glycosylase I [Neptuniibacter marinus]|uniref:DNA-3-methyladenine glycosylase I n=1 Tax=Neptuniibacter marinus TaxID=1806670 RepID=UPI0008297FCE|nr:DNA-3-methyladenine glycosylase I [Neptuniibacter marinus]
MDVSQTDGKKRCFGNKPNQSYYADYHDNEWSIPERNDQKLFEMLVLEGAQAGLSWDTVLKKREGYRQAFYQFDVHKVAAMSDEELEALRENAAIIRNKLKIYSARKNAIVFIAIQQEFSSFANYLWAYIDHKPIINHWVTFEQVPVTTEISDLISKDLKKRGMSFVGSTIIYAYMQAIGMVNDHLTECWCYKRDH